MSNDWRKGEEASPTIWWGGGQSALCRDEMRFFLGHQTAAAGHHCYASSTLALDYSSSVARTPAAPASSTTTPAPAAAPSTWTASPNLASRRFRFHKNFHTTGAPTSSRRPRRRRLTNAAVAAAMAAPGHQQQLHDHPPAGAPQQHVVVCGAGVMGACTAYFLAQKPGTQVTVVERAAPACAASGKAGGFLALDWCDSGPVGPLARASFALHQQLADDLDGAQEYGYRRLHTLSVTVHEEDGEGPQRRRSRSRRPGPEVVPAWVDGPVTRASAIGTPATTAQVHPALFTTTVLRAAVDKFGARLVTGAVQDIVVAAAAAAEGHDHGEQQQQVVRGVVVDGEVVPADAAVIAMGPWSATLAVLARLTTVSGLKAHSVVLRPHGSASESPPAVTPHALFLGYRTKQGQALEPEVYPRPNGEVYVCGMSEESAAVPADPRAVAPRAESVRVLQRVAGTVSSRLAAGAAEVTAEQACFLPCSQDGVPLVGRVPGVRGAFVATGHGCWGILNAPATGAALAELIADGAATTVDLGPFDPARFAKSARRKWASGAPVSAV